MDSKPSFNMQDGIVILNQSLEAAVSRLEMVLQGFIGPRPTEASGPVQKATGIMGYLEEAVKTVGSLHDRLTVFEKVTGTASQLVSPEAVSVKGRY